MTAPVPYSISTYGATKAGTRSPFTGFTTWTPSAHALLGVGLLAHP